MSIKPSPPQYVTAPPSRAADRRPLACPLGMYGHDGDMSERFADVPSDDPTGLPGMNGSLTGQLILATPRLTSPQFRRAVVLLLDHDDDGALGVILNRPTNTP